MKIARKNEKQGNVVKEYVSDTGCKIKINDAYIAGKTIEQCLEQANKKGRYKITYVGGVENGKA